MSRLPPALLISTTRPSVPAVRALGARGVPVWAATQEPGIASASRRLRDFFPTPSPLTEPDAFVARLLEIRENFPVVPVLLPCDDLTVGVIARDAATLAGAYRLAAPPPETALEILDKRRQYARLERAGIPLPRTWAPDAPEDAERIAAEARFPLVVKPSTAQQFLVTHGFKAVRVETGTELLAILDRFPGMVVQEIVPGEIEALYEHNSFVDRCGRLVVSSVTRKRDEDPKPFGSATAIETVNAPDVEGLGLRIVHALDYRGGSHSEIKRDAETGELRLIEFNPRFAWSAMVQIGAGVDTIYPAYAEAAGLPVDPPSPRQGRTLWFTPERITKGRSVVLPRPLPDSLPGPTRYISDLFDPTDPWDLGPLRDEVRNALTRRVAKLAHRLRAALRPEEIDGGDIASHSSALDRPTPDILAGIDPSLRIDPPGRGPGGFRTESAAALEGWDEFYEKFYRPSARDGLRGDTPDRSRLQRLARDARIDFAIQGDTRAAGVMSVPGADGELRILAAGVLYGSRRLRDAGALAAAYVAAIERAKREGFTRITWPDRPAKS